MCVCFFLFLFLSFWIVYVSIYFRNAFFIIFCNPFLRIERSNFPYWNIQTINFSKPAKIPFLYQKALNLTFLSSLLNSLKSTNHSKTQNSTFLLQNSSTSSLHLLKAHINFNISLPTPSTLPQVNTVARRNSPSSSSNISFFSINRHPFFITVLPSLSLRRSFLIIFLPIL